MKKRLIAAMSLAVCAAMGVCACSGGDPDNVFTGEETQVPEWQPKLNMITPEVYGTVDDLDLEPGTYISVIGKMENSSYWKQVQEGVQQAADDINEKLGYTGDDKVKVLFNAPADSEDIDEQVNILDEEMSRYPDVIAIASIDEDASAVQFDLAIGNGIPVVAFDSRNSYQGIQCTCMTDNAQAAADGAEKLCGVIGDSGEVALIVQDSVSGNARERAEAFRQEIAEGHPGVSIVETIYMDQLDEMKRQAAAEELPHRGRGLRRPGQQLRHGGQAEGQLPLHLLLLGNEGLGLFQEGPALLDADLIIRRPLLRRGQTGVGPDQLPVHGGGHHGHLAGGPVLRRVLAAHGIVAVVLPRVSPDEVAELIGQVQLQLLHGHAGHRQQRGQDHYDQQGLHQGESHPVFPRRARHLYSLIMVQNFNFVHRKTIFIIKVLLPHIFLFFPKNTRFFSRISIFGKSFLRPPQSVF